MTYELFYQFIIILHKRKYYYYQYIKYRYVAHTITDAWNYGSLPHPSPVTV